MFKYKEIMNIILNYGKRVDNCHTLCYKFASMFTHLFDSKAKRNALTILLGGAVFCVS